jgi:RNA polymerase sigma-70 factor, ECF subfamily
MGLSMCASLSSLCGPSIQPMDEPLQAARQGSLDARGELLEGCRAYLLLIANTDLASDLRAKVGASDLVQETFLAAHQDFSRFRGRSEGELLAWLRSILMGTLSDFSRRYCQTAKRKLTREVPLGGSQQVRAADARLVAANVPSPSCAAVAREEAQAVDDALARLPPDYVEVIVLIHRDHYSFSEAAEAMGRSVDAVRRLWTRAVERLTREIEAQA